MLCITVRCSCSALTRDLEGLEEKYFLRIFVPIARGRDGRGVPLNAFVRVRERNSSEATELGRDTK